MKSRFSNSSILLNEQIEILHWESDMEGSFNRQHNWWDDTMLFFVIFIKLNVTMRVFCVVAYWPSHNFYHPPGENSNSESNSTPTLKKNHNFEESLMAIAQMSDIHCDVCLYKHH